MDSMLDPDRLSACGLTVVTDGPVATVTLNRPDRRNAQTRAMWSGLAGIGRDLPGDVRVVVLRGAGTSFSAGLDLIQLQPGDGSLLDLAKADPIDMNVFISAAQEAFSWWQRPDLVSIARVQGHAIGAGFQLALACDFRVLADDAQLCMKEVSLGLVPDLGGTGVLVSLVGPSRALDICLTARSVGAAEADRMGLATRVVPLHELDQAVSELVDALVAMPRDALVEAKALLASARLRSLPEQRAAERSAQIRRLRDLVGLGE